ncbi:hypothetical protein [Streptomyces fructofermentans]|uniref:Uncharacterized protein n=1 Tax=Streptomyces fructofermentans TaxID=152141 RepID=A0A918NR17_9ACTN|nr:hypothetical protein [Streptomyces fructofermentans]GGX89150.1 hypothetical protein GCM10010515_65440 [Streptomyces fructofermentans]
MPRPTAAQLAYGSFTVIFSTLAMLLLSQTSSGPGVVVIALAALVLGLLVAVTVPAPKPTASRASAVAAASPRLAERRVPAQRETVAVAGASEPVRERA